ncbi:MAG TPA: hypothetical protein ENI15_21340 [Spirochaetes bacterium]|nr:hypothetical protein [Spirochaetota bacterium]
MVRDIDKTREKVGIDKLSMKERDGLFRQFVEHGGKIEYKINRNLSGQMANRCKSGPLKVSESPGPALQENRKSQQGPVNDSSQNRIYDRIKLQRPVNKNRLADLLILGFKGFMLKVTTFGGKKITHSFIKEFHEQIRWYFEEISVTLSSILENEPAVVEQIKRMSKGVNSIFYEVLVRLTALYDETEFLKIAVVFSRKKIPSDIYMKIFKQFFKKLYILAQFKNVCKTYVDKAVVLKGVNNDITRHVVFTVNNQLNKDMDVLFDDFLKKFHIILCRMARSYYPLFSQEFNDFLDISAKDRLGYITRMEKKKKKEEFYDRSCTIKNGKTKENKIVKIPEHIKKEIPVIRNIIEKYEDDRHYDLKCPIRVLDKEDTMYNAVVLLDIFDMRYSFLLSSSKTHYNIDYRDRRKINIKEELNHSYLLFNEAWDEAKGYVGIVKEIRDVQNNGRLTVYQRSVLLDTLVKKKTISRRNMNKRVTDVMKTIEKIMETVILDYDSDKRLLQNPDEILMFDEKIDRGKSSDGKRVIDAITEAYLFSAVFPYATGSGESNENEHPNEAGIDLNGHQIIIHPAAVVKSAS